MVAFHKARMWLAGVMALALFAGCGPSSNPALPAAAQSVSKAPVAQTKPAPALKPEAPPVKLDPALQKIVDEIMAKNDAVRSYTCIWDGSEVCKKTKGPMAGKTIELVHHEERAFKRPELLRAKITQIKTPRPGTTGTVCEKVVDETTSWQCTRNVAGSGQEVAAATRKELSDAEKAEIIRRHETPQVYRCDVKRLLEAGVWEKEMWPALEGLLIPFHLCDMATLKLDSEDADAWFFSAKPIASIAKTYSQVVLTIGKADGILREERLSLLEGEGENVQRISNVVLNPELPDSTFVFAPPEGVEVTDSTDTDIKTFSSNGK